MRPTPITLPWLTSSSRATSGWRETWVSAGTGARLCPRAGPEVQRLAGSCPFLGSCSLSDGQGRSWPPRHQEARGQSPRYSGPLMSVLCFRCDATLGLGSGSLRTQLHHALPAAPCQPDQHANSEGALCHQEALCCHSQPGVHVEADVG